MKIDKLRELRILKGLSQEYLAMELGISQKAYSNIENGKVNLSHEKLSKISEILGIIPSEVCGLACKCELNDCTTKKMIAYLKSKDIEIPDFLKN
jgi:transcriptional regulator with XRE-family HTH domain